VIVLTLTALAVVARAQQVNPVVVLQIKVLSADKNLTRNGDVVIGLVYAPETLASNRSLLRSYEKTAALLSIGGKRPRVVELPYDADSFANAVAKAHVTVLVTIPGLGDALVHVTQVARERQLSTLSFVRADLDHGVAVAVHYVDERPRITIQLTQARACGMELGASLLRLAEVVR